MRFNPRFFTVLVACMLLPGCWLLPQKTIVPAPANVPAAAALGDSRTAQLSKASAYVQAAQTSNDKNPDGAPKDAVKGSLDVAQANLPVPAAADLTEALKFANQALSGQLTAAQANWKLSVDAGTALQDKLSRLEAQVSKERADAAAEQTRLIRAAHDEERLKAEADQRKLVGWIFYGGGALLIAGAGLVAFLAPSVPIFGPRLALGLGVAGAALIGSGVALNEILAHPTVIWVTLGTAGAALAVSGGIALSNHYHHTDASAAK